MAFNPYGYQNPYYPQPMPDNLAQLRQAQMQPMMPQPMPQSQPAGGVQWVSGEQEARGYLIAPNSAIALWDSSAPVVYLKQADASGKPTLKAYDLVERTEMASTTPQKKGVEFVTREEFERLAALVGEIKGKKKRKSEEGDEDDE